MTCGIYRITNLSTGRHYIGQAQDIPRRWSVHRFHLRKGTHSGRALQRAWSKHGEANFEFVVILQCEPNMLDHYEVALIDYYDTLGGNGYNCRTGGKAARGYKHSAKTKEKMRQTAKRRAIDPEERKRRSERAKAQHAAGKLGRTTWAPETKPEISDKARTESSKRMKKYMSTVSSEEMSRRSKMRKCIREAQS